jgi:hypothetical protein
MDTKFLLEALAELTELRVCELTSQELSHVLRRAQELKDEAQLARWCSAEA